MGLIALTSLVLPTVQGAYAETSPPIRVDVPVLLKQAKVVFNMDHPAFNGDTPIGLAHMAMMSERFQKAAVDWKIIAVFHGAAGYMLLTDEKYNEVRKTKTGNPYKILLQTLAERGVQIEECAFTMKANGWTNEDIIPIVKINSGADMRIIDLVQQGYVMLQP
jgi:intracellular sulfur oxidation DsrE/DsrF family protein